MIPTILHRRVFVLALICIPLFLFPQVANACGCAGETTTVLDDYQQSDAVVIARLLSTEKFGEPNPMYIDNIREFTMRVEKVFKGSVKVQDRLRFQQGNGLDCLWTLYNENIGNEYLLYLQRPEKTENPWFVWGCGRSKDLSKAADDLLYLSYLDKRRGRTRISGTYRDAEDSSVLYEGRKIRVIGNKKIYIATTDKNGVYELYDAPPGTYLLEPELPFGWRVEQFGLTRSPKRSELNRAPSNRVSFTLRPKKHFGINIAIKLSNRVTGAIYDPSGKPMERVCVSLMPTNDERYVGCNSSTDELGRFQIDSVEAGSYVLVLNYENKKTSRMPFPSLYYPGVTNRKMATVLNIKHGESLRKLNVTVPVVASTVLVEGVVRYADGTPASDRWVGLKPSKRNPSQPDVSVTTDVRGRFSFKVLKGSTGELYSTFPPSERDYAKCPKLRALLKSSGKQSLVFETQRINFDGVTRMSGLRLKFPVSPCTRH